MTLTKLVNIVHEEIYPISNGALNCLPFARVLVRTLHLLGEAEAKEVVARVVVFGARAGLDYEQLFLTVSPQKLVAEALRCDNANGKIVATLRDPITARDEIVEIPFRTLGYPHGKGEIGEFHGDGTWTGHIVVGIGTVLVDLTIGQINHPDFGINIELPGLLIDTSPERPFSNGFEAVFTDGQFVYYEPFPDEVSYLDSRSWGATEFRESLEQISARIAERVRNETQAKQADAGNRRSAGT